VVVDFAVTLGGGALEGASPLTGVDGFAAVSRWTLGSTPGLNVLSATTASAGLTVEFNATGVADPPVAETVSTLRVITAAWRSACGLTPTGAAYCWGSNGYQQLGDGTFASVRLTPIRVSGGLEFVALEGAGNGNFYCAVTAAQAAYCWGSNWHGQPGDGVTPMNPGSTIGTPVPVAGNLTWQVVRPGGDHACGLTTSGEAWCWGANNRAQLGDLVSPDRNFPGPAAPGLVFKDLAVGANHNCGLTSSGDVYCWGSRDGFTALGIAKVPTPTLIPGGIKFESLTAGASTCGLTSDGAAYCWGSNANGQLGNGSTIGSSTPQPVSSALKFKALSARGTTACGLVTGGAAYCWGANASGQAGTGGLGNLTTPTPVSGDLAFTTITVSTGTTCGLVDPGVPWCWGPNDSGQVGDGTNLQRAIPTHTRLGSPGQ
jgi:alpha-tubulin suppressor-like RCC1 family protein